ncbi:MAG: hypothetical protein KJ626_02210 [Verrucomicrobia bacterium]|nr:hypothetical protein [Verrucomicrobiota bacterium]
MGKSRGKISDASSWEATIVRENGETYTLRNLGERFASYDLKRGETCQICLTVPGLEVGTQVTLSSTHGGKIDGRARRGLKSERANEVCFTYTMGTLGAHPLKININARSKSMLFTVISESKGPRRQSAERSAQK